MVPTDYARFLDADGVAIYLFHGVLDRNLPGVRNYTRKHLPRDYFRAVLESLTGAGRALSIDDLVSHYVNGIPFPKRSFVISFDDGFENNFSVAAPILEEFSLPAIFYLTSGFIEHQWMSWIDRIELAFDSTTQRSLKLDWEAKPRAIGAPQEKIAALVEIRRYVKTTPSLNIDAFVSSIFRQCAVSEVAHSDHPLDRKMTWGQVRQLLGNPLFSVGGHSHSHATLSFLSPEKLSAELDMSIKLFQARLSVAPRHYAYPDGEAHHYNADVVEALKRRGVICCPTAIQGVNLLGDPSELFHLKRIMVV